MHHFRIMLPLPGGGILAWGLAALILALLVVLALRFLGGMLQDKGNAATDRDHSLDILRNRLAMGEISEDDYLHLREILGK